MKMGETMGRPWNYNHKTLEGKMETYAMFRRWTQEGVTHVKDAPDGIDLFPLKEV
jgi:hypothetical protein